MKNGALAADWVAFVGRFHYFRRYVRDLGATGNVN